MALQKRLDYGFNGYQLPPTPRAARSARRRSLFKRKSDSNQMCAFDLLATVAGKLLLDGENPPSATTSSRKEHPANDEHKSLEEKSRERGCYERNFLFTEIVSEAPNPSSCTNKLACSQNDVISRPASGITSSNCSEKIGPAEKLVSDDCKLSLGIPAPVDVESSGLTKSVPDDESRKHVKSDSANISNLSINNKVSLCKEPDSKSSALVCSVDSVKFPFSRDPARGGSLPGNRENVKLVTRDDDDNSPECIEPSIRNKAPGDHRFRKHIALKHCKVTASAKDDEGFTERCNYLNRKNGFKRHQRSLRDYPFKKRKLYECSSVSNSDESISGDGMFRVSENGANEDELGYVPPLSGNAAPTSVAGAYASFHSRNSQVKLRIKSFRVPELFIEIPETATVGSLKRMVMEAVNTVLGSGLRVGLLLQGKKIRDDSKTLVQTGISHDNKMDTLGFTLEPSPAPASMRSYSEDCPGQLLRDNPQPLARYPPGPITTQNAVQERNQDTHSDHHHGSFNKLIESDHDSVPSRGTSLQRSSESKALVPVPTVKHDALAVVPVRKSKRSECTQRRIRRPFTVAEVEALVQAVEKLGTGRWRDVKLRAFDNAKHRTYVDLKDKWKTLVHTAGISPQQRRGEPVPQELLDRVLAAHAYWSQQQPKQQHLKSHPHTCLLL